MKLRLIFAFLCFSSILFSQVDSLKIDSIPQHSVKKAVIFSTILPCAGQVYNYLEIPKGVKGKNNLFWKIPVFYSAIGATGYFLVKNQSTQQSLKTEYNYRLDNPNSISDPNWADYDSTGLVQAYNKYASRRDLSIIAFGAAYLFQVIDAGVEAHFVKFDISEDLTLQITPVILNRSTPGIGLCFNFR